MVTFVCLALSVIILFRKINNCNLYNWNSKIISDEIITVCFYLNGLRK